MLTRTPNIAAMCAIAIFALIVHSHLNTADAEYGDVIMNEYADDAGVRPVVFPHWFHRIRFRCKVCHGDLGFAFEAGGNDINMLKIIDGEYCGACHDGNVAWSIENCDLCHSGVPNTPTQVHHSTAQRLVVPTDTDGGQDADAVEEVSE
jgi:c(7)-type cytochrome triheme protein